MKAIAWNTSTLVWLALSAATAVSWWLGTQDATAPVANAQNALAMTIILISFFKVWLVIRYFMEVRDAPLPLKILANAWVVVVCLAVMAFFRWA